MKTLQIDINGQLIYAPFCNIKDAKYTNTYDVLRALTLTDIDDTITRILLTVNSNGGMVQSLKEVADKLQEIKCKGITIITYVTGNCCSAAYHVACASHKIYATNSAAIGSIGACLTIDDALKTDDDLKMRSKGADYKNPEFPLSDDFKAYLQQNLDDSGQEFIDYVKSQRVITDDIVFSGKSFKASKALELNLIDDIIPLTAIL